MTYPHQFASLLWILLLIAVSSSNAQQSIPVTIDVTGYVDAGDGDGELTVSGTFLPSTPTANDAYKIGSSGWANVGDPVNATISRILIEPGRAYEISIGGSYVYTAQLSISAPPGYQVVLDGKARIFKEVSSVPGIAILQVIPKQQDPLLAAIAGPVSVNRIDWRLPLGTLRDGESAGSIGLLDSGLGSSWSQLFTPSRLFYESTSDDVWVYRVNNSVRQVVAMQVAVDVVTLSSESYELRCYNPEQIVSSTSTPRLFNGFPFVTYKISRGTPQSPDPSAVLLQFTRETRNVVDFTNDPGIARRDIMTLERVGLWPAYKWTMRPWTEEGYPALSETVVQSAGPESARSEDIIIRTPDAGGSAYRSTRTYQLFSGFGELMVSETVGTQNQAHSAVSYYSSTNPQAPGSALRGAIASVTLPGGTWTAYEYDLEGSNGYRRVFRPIGNLPATPTRNNLQGEVELYGYTYDLYGLLTRPSTVNTYYNGVHVKTKTFTYADQYTYTQVDETNNDKSASQYFTKTSRKYVRDDDPDKWLAGKIISVATPDLSKVGYLYERGNWNGTTFTQVSNGASSRISKVTGHAIFVTGAPHFKVQHPDIVVLVEGKSERHVKIRDKRGLIVREEVYVCDSANASNWQGGSWKLVEWTNFSYNVAGLLIATVRSNGATQYANYNGILLINETDEGGGVTQFTYDAGGRLKITSRDGSTLVGELRTTFQYDAAGNVLIKNTGPENGEQLIETQTYDDAGRLSSETGPGGYGTITHSYDPASRSLTSLWPDGGSITKSHLLDGRPLTKTGSRITPEYYSYGLTSANRRISRTDFLVANSPR